MAESKSGPSSGSESGPELEAGSESGSELKAGSDSGPALKAGSDSGPELKAGSESGSGLESELPQGGPGARPEAAVAPKRARKWPWIVLLGAGVAVAAFYFGGGWYFSGEVYKSALQASTYDPGAIETGKVTAVDIGVDGTGTITVARDSKSAAETKNNDVVVGLKVGDQILVAGPATDVVGADVTRPVLQAAATPELGAPVGLVRDIWLQPAQAGMEYEEVTVNGPLGPLPTWWIKGSDPQKWAVLTHGKGASRSEMLRMARPLVADGYNIAVCSYRNDAGTAPSADGMVRYGATEWEDLQACVKWVLDQGPQQLVLGGVSHGAAVTLGFLARSELASQVDALIFDSPAASLPDVIDAAADYRTIPIIGSGIPESLQSVATWITSLRYGVDMSEVDYTGMPGLIKVPTLVIQGDDDQTAPLAATDRFVAAFPDHITYVRVPGAEHVLTWNVDPEAYEGAVREFLAAAGLS